MSLVNAIYQVTTPKCYNSMSEFENEPHIKQVIDIFNKYNIEYTDGDSVDGDYNLNRQWLVMKNPIEMNIEYGSVRPTQWNKEDFFTIDDLVYNGDIFVQVLWVEVNSDGTKRYILNH